MIESQQQCVLPEAPLCHVGSKAERKRVPGYHRGLCVILTHDNSVKVDRLWARLKVKLPCFENDKISLSHLCSKTSTRVGWFGRMALKHVFYHTWNRSPVQVWCMRQGAQGWCTGMTQKDGMGREVGGGSAWGTCVHPWWIHVDVWQNQYSIVT